MKLLTKILTSAAVLTAVYFMASCQQPSGGNSVPDSSADQTTVAAAKDTLTITDGMCQYS
jgi:hypothetical protein